MSRIFLTGISGQDGSYLAEHMLNDGHEVFGIVRRNSVPEHQESRLKHITDRIQLMYGDVTDFHSLVAALTVARPDEVYNLAAQSHVRISSDVPIYTAQTNAVGVLNVLEATRQTCPKARFYQASSCLPAGTQILCRKETSRIRFGKKEKFLTLGTKSIEELVVGDEVLSMDIQSSKKEYCHVLKTGSRDAQDMFNLTFSNRNALRLSGNHPVYVIGKGYVRTDEVAIGDSVIQKRYNGLCNAIARKGRKNEEIYGVEESKKIREKSSASHLNSTYVHPWKGKKLEEVFASDPEKHERIKARASLSHLGQPAWNKDISRSKNSSHKKAWEIASKKIGEAHKRLWDNDEYASRKIKLLIARKPKSFKINKTEKRFLELIDGICPGEFAYNEDGKLLLLGRMIPDFVNINGKKKLIEFDGNYWHSLPGRKEQDEKKDVVSRKMGYELLRISEKEFLRDPETVREKVLTFVYNPSVDIVNITSIERSSPEKVYDIEVEKNHNFFARGILVHNSEMFGNSVDPDGFQRETTPMNPVSPYGCAKLYGYHMVRHYRHAYKMFASNGILFNHESPRRGSNFVTSKIIQGAVLIKLGKQDKLELGNLKSFRDWGHSRDYTRAMIQILRHDWADDFVVATGQTHSVEEFCQLAFSRVGIEDWWHYVVVNPRFVRPEELKYLKGDSSKVRSTLQWEPKTSFEEMVGEMTDHWLNLLSKE